MTSLASSLTPSLPAASMNILPTPALARLFQEDETVPGTTEGILLMGILIVLIIVIPIVWTRRRWMR